MRCCEFGCDHGSVTLEHRPAALFASDVAAPVELASAILRLPHGLEATSTAEHVAASWTGGVGALASLGSYRASLPIGEAKVGRPV